MASIQLFMYVLYGLPQHERYGSRSSMRIRHVNEELILSN
eukprot:gene3045-2230_t